MFKQDSNVTWQDILTNIFGGFVNQQTIEEGAEEMVLVSESCLDLHHDYLMAIDCGIAAAKSGDSSIVAIVNRSGYRVDSTQAAVEILGELRNYYLEQYVAATKKTRDDPAT
jgi:hypothetical protein